MVLCSFRPGTGASVLPAWGAGWGGATPLVSELMIFGKRTERGERGPSAGWVLFCFQHVLRFVLPAGRSLPLGSITILSLVR